MLRDYGNLTVSGMPYALLDLLFSLFDYILFYLLFLAYKKSSKQGKSNIAYITHYGWYCFILSIWIIRFHCRTSDFITFIHVFPRFMQGVQKSVAIDFEQYFLLNLEKSFGY